jgi:D-aspartate ligase
VKRSRRGPTERAGTQIGAVVCGGCYLALGVVRSLGRRGIPVCVIDDEYSISRFSHYTVHAVRIPDFRDEARAVEDVLNVGRRLGLEGWVLYPTREEIVAAFSRHRSELAELFRVPTPGWDTVKWAWDKRNTYRLAQDLEIPTPRTWYPAAVDDLEQIDAPFPLVIKPAIKEHFLYATNAKAWRADTRAELVERYQRASALVPPGEIMVQELIPGDGQHQFACCAFFKDGRSLGTMVARRRRQHPPEFGRASTYAETVEEPLLEQLSERFLGAIDFYGLVELEYKLDGRDARYKLLDVNMRAWGYHSLGPRAGVDFPYLLFADQVGEAVEPCRAREGVRWIRLTTDLPTAVYELSRGRLDWRAYLQSLRSFDTEAVFSRDDPLPGLVELALIPYLALRRGF